MLRNETIYPDAEAFIPERFLTGGESQKNAEKHLEATWGFGRRLEIIMIYGGSRYPTLF